MITIKKPIQQIIDILGVQEVHNYKQYRPSVYTIILNVSGGILLYNTFLCSLFLLREKNEKDSLIKNWLFVPIDCNEIELVKKTRSILREQKTFDGISTYTIFPTTDCNARCLYCFENDIPKIKMTNETALKCAEYIINHSKDKDVNLRWFGGEPLFFQKPINIICSKLHDANIQFKSKMVTNGYLFNYKTIERAKKIWNLIQVQITLDGTKDNYNKIKNYKYNSDAFSIVINNIDLLLKSDIQVIIRLNIDNSNIEDQIKLVREFITKKYKGNKLIKIYSHPLMDALLKSTKEERRFLFNKKAVLDNIINTIGLSTHDSIPVLPKLYRCITDNKESLTFLPSGKIGLCEHYTESHFIGDLYLNEKTNKKEIELLCHYNEDIKICTDCPYYPRCIRLMYCPDSGICYNEIKQQKIQHLRNEALAEYKLWQINNNLSFS